MIWSISWHQCPGSLHLQAISNHALESLLCTRKDFSQWCKTMFCFRKIIYSVRHGLISQYITHLVGQCPRIIPRNPRDSRSISFDFSYVMTQFPWRKMTPRWWGDRRLTSNRRQWPSLSSANEPIEIRGTSADYRTWRPKLGTRTQQFHVWLVVSHLGHNFLNKEQKKKKKKTGGNKYEFSSLYRLPFYH